MCTLLCFTLSGETCDAKEQNGYKVMVLLFSGKPKDNLASLGHNVLKKKAVSATSVANRIPLLEMLLPNHDMAR